MMKKEREMKIEYISFDQNPQGELSSLLWKRYLGF